MMEDAFGLTLAGARLRHGLCPRHEGALDSGGWCWRCIARYRLERRGSVLLIAYENSRGEAAKVPLWRNV